MGLSTYELRIIEILLQDMINKDYEPAIAYILHKVRTEIKQRTGEFNRTENRGW